MGEESGEHLALDASMTEHMEAYRRVVRQRDALAVRLADVQDKLHRAQHHAGIGIARCVHGGCMATRLLIEAVDQGG